MYARILLLLILGFVTITFADSAVQTDWSGGDGIIGPVSTWGNEFYMSSTLDWTSFPGSLASLGFLEHTVDEDFFAAQSVYSADINGDGYMDVLGASNYIDDITWWENVDGSGEEWTEHIVDGDFDGAMSVYSADINGDGYMDILGGAAYAMDVAWWENMDGSGTNWTEHTVDGDVDGLWTVHSADINGDGFMDILGAAWSSTADIAWWENVDGSGTSWIKHAIEGPPFGGMSVYSADINEDGYMDVLGAGYAADDITWWENSDTSPGTIWTEHTVDGDFDLARSVYSDDINGDGYLDVLGAGNNSITWWENVDSSGTSWTEHTIDNDFDEANSVYSADINGDGCMDVLGAALIDDDITWWENVDGSGTSWIEHTVDGAFDGALSVYSADINGDGFMDVLGAALYDYNINWWELTLSGWLESSILGIHMDPEWEYLEWSSVTPPGTSVSFQIRASDDHTAMGVWSDTLSIPSPLQGILTDGDQYVQYRVILETSNPDTTPVLFDLTLTWNPMGIEGGENPAILALLPFSPNPSSLPAARFSLPEPAYVDISIFDLSGRIVSEIHGDEYSPGYYEILLEELYSGLFFCRMISGDFTATQCFVVIE